MRLCPLCAALALLPVAAVCAEYDAYEAQYQYRVPLAEIRMGDHVWMLGEAGPVASLAPPKPVLSVRVGQERQFPSPIAAADRYVQPPVPEDLPGKPAMTPKAVAHEEPNPCAVAVVHFALGAATIPAVAAAELRTSVEKFARRGDALVIQGFTCDLGGEALNNVLALRRARAAATVLTEAGYRVDSARGIGRSGYCTLDRGVRAVNRRVEVRRADETISETHSPEGRRPSDAQSTEHRTPKKEKNGKQKKGETR